MSICIRQAGIMPCPALEAHTFLSSWKTSRQLGQLLQIAEAAVSLPGRLGLGADGVSKLIQAYFEVRTKLLLLSHFGLCRRLARHFCLTLLYAGKQL